MMMRAILLAAAIAALTVEPALAGDCDALITATIKHLRTPHRTIMVINEVGSVSTMQFVLLDGKLYVESNNAPVWTVIDLPPDTAEAMFRKSISDENLVCRADGSEPIDGEVYDIVATHRKGQKGDVDSRVWIARKTSLLFKVEDNMAGGRRETSTYSYGDVVAPANSQPPAK